MAGLDKVEVEVQVKEIMTSPVITVLEDDTAKLVANLMSKHRVGSIIVTDKRGKSIGIITEKDIVDRVAAKDLLPSKVKAIEAMSSPLVTIDPSANIIEAAQKMKKHDIRRLVVIKESRLVGIISSKDIVAITPSLIEVITEKVIINQSPPIPKEHLSSGYCDNCDQWADSLREIDGKLLCEDCSLEQETTEI